MITVKNQSKHLVTGPVAIPECPDCDFYRGEKTFSANEIEDMVHEYNTKYRNADQMHIFNDTGDAVGQSVENWTLKEPMSVKNINGTTVQLPKGTWMTTIKITDDNTWNKISNGELRGFSAMYVPGTVAERFAAKDRVLVKDLENPVPVSVAVVDKPCVFDAIFTSVKSEEESSEKAGRQISNSTLDKLKNAYETAQSSLDNLKSLLNTAETERKENNATKSEELDVDEKEMKEAMKEAVKSEVKPLKEEITSLKGEIADLKSEKSEEEEKEKEESSEKSEEKKEKEAKKKEPEKSEKSEGNGLKGQDGQGEHKEATKSVYEASGRDALGIKRKTRG